MGELLLNMLKLLNIKPGLQDEDLFPDQPGFKDFLAAQDMEYEKKNYQKASDLYEKACKAGHPLAQANYALWFLEGSRKGYKKNFRKAFELFEKSAEKGVGLSLYNLAHFYQTGKGGVVKQDPFKAFSLVKKSLKDYRTDKIRNGDPYWMLGTMYLQGEGTCMNRKKAQQHFEKARQFGHKAATTDFMKMTNLLAQLSGADKQHETDSKWDTMCAWLDKHPEEKGKDGVTTMRNHLKILNKFGFDIYGKLTEKELEMKGGFDKFMEVSGGQMYELDEYEMQDVPTVRVCSNCSKPGAKKRCAKCGEAYCDKKCQKADWTSHRKICQIVRDNIS
ncbi:unnamed protein product [Owenia fusiformis]|uniref:Uncharacterized protein n=1 Tax=Owenia fusiformis TaxID=6347 RepID=A0A8J1TAY3_OWEFU|nr:unnamed protein product [Owenia fusiformis]